MDITGGEQKNARPYVIVSRDQINRFRRNIVGIPLTKQLHQGCSYRITLPLEWQIPNPASSRPLMKCVCLSDHIRVLDKIRLEQPKMGSLSDTARYGLIGALATIFDIP
jgi:mRNA-degrading endonuclease toxin of MazEF toxin-antitoxin module